jgi:hypothetical protein
MANPVTTITNVANNMTVGRVLLIAAWVCGVVLAKGFWSTFFAVIIPFWAWYLAAERMLQHFGVN